ncbi:multicopper oxidase family protein [Nannocystis pusilla]|uniref:multicopper oxidase family protein n=1 Tax=Nannocystis pusilla TaxID=889268 RepID=UPI003BF42A1C
MFRRSFLRIGSVAAGAALTCAGEADAQHPGGHASHGKPAPPSGPVPPSTPVARSEFAAPGQVAVVTPDGVTLPWRLVGGVKVGHLVAEEIEHVFAPGLSATAWGYNGRTPGPTIEAVEGDRVRLYVTNRLPEPTSVHWHGVVVPNGMDGVSGLTQRPIPPGETFVYEFTLRRAGTFMYHSHFDEMVQIAFGMVGMFVVHPRRPLGPPVDRDFVLMTHEWRLEVGARRPNPIEMTDFNVLTFNSKAFPGTQPMLVARGERVRLRLGNLGPMDHHPIHIHGVSFKTTGTDGGFIPPGAQVPESTVLVPVGSTRVIEFVPDEPGDWIVHCHMTHHMMTQMGHNIHSMVGADTKNLDERMRRVAPAYMTMGTTGMGAMTEMNMPVPPNSLPMRGTPGPFSTIDMGGMVTILKVRERPSEADITGYYEHPPGTVAGQADAAQMAADGVDVGTGNHHRS